MSGRSTNRIAVALALTLALVAAACSSGSDDAGSQDGDGGDDTATTISLPVNTNERGQRAQTLGQAGAVISSQTPQDRLANGFAPLPDTPLFEGDYADPFVLAVGPSLYLYTTNTLDQNVPVLQSAAGVVGIPTGDALPDLPPWTRPGLVWAPSVLSTDDGYVMYYTSVDDESGLQCVGAAFSDSPTGPFVDERDEPFVCQRELGGTIDASPFVDDDGTAWLLYKNDGNCCDIVTELWSQELSDDGLDLVGDPVSLLSTTESWEGPLIEGPSMVRSDGTYWLFYSANWWDSADYTIGAASCESPTGPCTKIDQPWLSSHGDAAGPGGPEEFTDARGNRWLVYHAWITDEVGYDNGGARALFAVPLDLGADPPVATGLTTG